MIDLDLREWVSRYTKVYRVGSRHFISCVFHSPDKTPSMIVHKSSFFCFSCKKKGGVRELVYHLEPSPQAYLKDMFGSREDTGGNFEMEQWHLKQSIKNRLKWVRFLKNKGVCGSLLRLFHIGYHCGASVKNNLLLNSGSCYLDKNHNMRSVLENRVCFGLININNMSLSGFTGRSVEEGLAPKYKNSCSSKMFEKKKCVFMHKLDWNFKKPLVICEGPMDVLGIYTNNSQNYNVCGVIGTGCDFLVKWWLSNTSSSVILALDNDEAGIASMLKTMKDLRSNYKLLCRVCVWNYPYSDPGDMLSHICMTIDSERLISGWNFLKSHSDDSKHSWKMHDYDIKSSKVNKMQRMEGILQLRINKCVRLKKFDRLNKVRQISKRIKINHNV